MTGSPRRRLRSSKFLVVVSGGKGSSQETPDERSNRAACRQAEQSPTASAEGPALVLGHPLVNLRLDLGIPATPWAGG